ncbi:MAG: phage portal protein [Fusobacteriaceae bacterium]
MSKIKDKNKEKKEEKEQLNNNLVKNIKNYSEFGASKRKNAFRGVPDIIKTAKEDIGYNKETMIARGRNSYMGSMIGSAAVKKIRTNVIGTGLELKSNINNIFLKESDENIKKYETQIEELWRIWAESTECDFKRFSNFAQLQSTAMLSLLIDGDIFALLVYEENKNGLFELKVNLIDSARVKTPPSQCGNKNIQNGIKLDNYGRMESIYILKDESSITYDEISVIGEKSGRKNVLILFEKERPDQVRGVPLVMSALEGISQIGKFTEAELMNAAVSALFSVFIETDPKLDDETETNPIDNVEVEEDLDGDVNFKLGSGNIMNLPPGKKISFADPQRPNAKFDGFVTAVMKQIGASLEIPFEVLLNAFNSNYSASRAALMEVWKMYSMRRKWFVNDFCQPIFEEWLDEAVAKKYISLPGYETNILKRKAYQSSKWFGPTQGQLDPSKEVKAAVEKINNNLSTVEQETAVLNGGNSDKNFEIRKQEAIKEKEIDEIKNGSEVK